MKDLTVTLVQSTLHWESPEENRAMFAKKISGIEEKTDLIILPEMFTTGFSMNASNLAEDMNGPTVQWMKKMANSKDAAITGSLIIKERDGYFNRMVWALPNGEVVYYDKRHLFTMAKEELTFNAGKKRLIVEWKGWKICPLVCYDLRFPVWSRNDVGYDLLIYVANWPEKRSFAWKNLLQTRAIENQAWSIGVNRVGTDGNGWTYTGDSSIYGPLGAEPFYQNSSKEEVFTYKLNAKRISEVRNRMPFLTDMDEFHVKL